MNSHKKRYLIICCVALTNHDCQECKTFYDIPLCLTKDIKGSQYLRDNLIISDYISKKRHLESILRIQKLLPECGLYYKSAYQNFIKKQYKIFRKEQYIDFIVESDIRFSIEHLKQLVDLFLKIVDQQVKLWKLFIQGHPRYTHYIYQIEQLSNNMLAAKELIEQLKQAKTQNIISLRSIQTFYTLVFYSPSMVYQLEEKISGLILNDRYKLDCRLTNILLQEGRFLLLKMSLVNNKGQLCNPSQKQLQIFMDVKKDLYIKNLTDLLPHFLENIHDKFMENLINRGYSIYTKDVNRIYMKKPDGFLLHVGLQIDYDDNQVDDFILNALITKPDVNPRFILFSPLGTILGMDSQIFEILKVLVNDNNITISHLLDQGILIQIFLAKIQQSVNELRIQINEEGINTLNDIHDFWLMPTYTNNSLKRLATCRKDYERIKTKYDLTDEIRIKNCEIDMLSPQFQNSLTDLMDNQNTQTTVQYNLEFVTNNYNGGVISYFILTLCESQQEVQNISPQDSPKFDRQRFKTFIIRSLNVEKVDQDEGADEYQESNSYKATQPVQVLYNKFMDSLINKQQNTQLNSNHDEDMVLDTNKYPSRDFQFLKSLTTVRQKQKLKIVAKSQKQKLKRSVQSSQASSSFKEYELIIQQLQMNINLIKPIKRNILFTLFMIAGLIISIIGSLVTISQNTQAQTEQVNYIKYTQEINYAYTSILAQFYFQVLQQNNRLTLSPFILEQNANMQQQIISYSQQTVTVIQVIVYLQMDTLHLDRLNQSTYIGNNQTVRRRRLFEFYNRFMNSYTQAYENQEFSDLYSAGFLRQNMVTITNLHNTFINSLIAVTLEKLQTTQQNLIYYLVIEICGAVFVSCLLLKGQIDIDRIRIDIINIFAKIQQWQAEEQIQRIKDIGSILETEYWLKQSLFQIQFKQSNTSLVKDAKQIKTLQSNLPQQRFFNLKGIVLILLCLFLNLAFLLLGHMIYYIRNDQFQPSLQSSLNFVKFRHNFDTVLLYGCAIKADPLMPEYDSKKLNQTEIISLFMNYSQQVSLQLDDFIKRIYTSDLQYNDQFSQILYQNLCTAPNNQNLKTCHLSSNAQINTNKDLYFDLISSGILGYLQQFIKYTNQEYNYETTTLSYSSNITQLLLSINEDLFQNFFLQYFLEIQEMMKQFLNLFTTQNNVIADNIYVMAQEYYIIAGVFLILLNILVYVVWIYMNQYQMSRMRQLIGIIPVTQFESQNFRYLIIKIHRCLY